MGKALPAIGYCYLGQLAGQRSSPGQKGAAQSMIQPYRPGGALLPLGTGNVGVLWSERELVSHSVLLLSLLLRGRGIVSMSFCAWGA